MTCKIIRERTWNITDSPEKEKKEKREKKRQKEEIRKRTGTNTKMKNGSDTVLIGDSLKNGKGRTDDGIGKQKKPNLLYIVIVLGMDFFCAWVWTLWLNIDHT